MTSPIGRTIYCFTIFILWIAPLADCDSTASNTTIICSESQKLCGGKFCYNPATQFCSETGSIITCITACGNQCYDSTSQQCINGTVCMINEDVCEVKHDSSTGALIEPSQRRCYDTYSQRCLNHTICYPRDRFCNGQCILYHPWYESDYKICANDNKTLCRMPLRYTSYQRNQIQVCNGTCFDTENPPLHRCVNGIVQCTSKCSNICYYSGNQICINGTLCPIGYALCQGESIRECYDPARARCLNGKACAFGEKTCLVDRYTDRPDPLSPPRLNCYDPSSMKCIDGVLCSNNRICNGKCITGYNYSYQVCANDKRTVCNTTSPYNSYCRPYPMHVCNGKCFDTSVQQCINGAVSCIDDMCRGECYNFANHVCLNRTLCPVGSNLCEVKYDSSSGNPIEPSRLDCYDPRWYRCLNHTICYQKDRVCNGQCILNTEWSEYEYAICANDNRTLCKMPSKYTSYQPNQIQVCNDECFDIGNPPLQRCVDGAVQCILNCSGTCYYSSNQICIHGILCPIGYTLCQSDSRGECYHPAHTRCLNGTVCSSDRVCGERCLHGYNQVCANDKRTVCNVSGSYQSYKPNQIQLCRGVCYDSFLQHCTGNPAVSCIHDPDTQECVAQNINPSTTTTTLTSKTTAYNPELSANTSPLQTSMPTSDAEATSGSITLLDTTITVPSSISPQLTSLSTSQAEFSTDFASDGTSTTFQASKSTPASFLSSNTSSDQSYITATSSSVTPSSPLPSYPSEDMSTVSTSSDETSLHILTSASSYSTNLQSTTSDTSSSSISSSPVSEDSDTVSIPSELIMSSILSLSSSGTTEDPSTPYGTSSSSIWASTVLENMSTASISSDATSTETFTGLSPDDTTTVLYSSDTTSPSILASLSSTTTNISWMSSDQSSTTISSSLSSGITLIQPTSPDLTSSPSPSSSSFEDTITHSTLSNTSGSPIPLSSVSETTDIQSIVSDMTPFPILTSSTSEHTTTVLISSDTSSPSISSSSSPDDANTAKVPPDTTPFPSSSRPSFETTYLESTSSGTSSFPMPSNPSSTSNPESTSITSSATTHTDSAALTTETETPSRPVSHLPTSSPRTSEAPCGATSSITPPFLDQSSCCPRSAYTNDTGSCTPRVECRCYGNIQKRDNNQACRAIVIGGNNNNSLVVAIAVNDKKVIIINNTHFLLLLVCAGITLLLLLLLAIGSLVVVYHKGIRITLRLWYLSIKNFKAEAQRKEWEKR